MTTTSPPGTSGSGDVTTQAPAGQGLMSAMAPTAASGMLRAGMQSAGLMKAGSGASRRRIGEVLIAQGVINEEQLQSLLAEQAQFTDPKKRPRLGRLVVEKGLANEKQIAMALASALGLEIVDLARVTVPPEIARVVPKAVSERPRHADHRPQRCVTDRRDERPHEHRRAR